MIFALIFLFELLSLFFLSKLVQYRISAVIYKATRNPQTTIYLMAFLFFPGTIIHELSHLLMAGLLFVRTGSIDLWPKMEGDGVKLGSVTVAETDIFRRFLIGAAPFFFGTSLIVGLLFFAAQNNLFSNYLYSLILGYAAFEIGNTMFSSPKDMEGALELLATLLLLGTIFYFLGVRLSIGSIESIFANPIITQVFHRGSIYLLIPLTIDILLLAIIKLFTFKRIPK